MTEKRICLAKFLFREKHAVLEQVLGSKTEYEIHEYENAAGLADFLNHSPVSLVITSLKDKSDLIQIATIMKFVKKNPHNLSIKIVVIDSSGEKSFVKALENLGIQDVIEPRINFKVLKFKLEFWIKSLNAQMKKNSDLNRGKGNRPDSSAGDDQKVDSSVPIWVDALDVEDDIWLIRDQSSFKKVLSKWLVRLTGPSPFVGQWIEVKNGLWKFDFRETEKELFSENEKGAWFFSGTQKPDFVWKENTWLISGENFDLFFKDDEQSHSRLTCKNKILTLCKNSEFAKSREQAIIDSFDKELVLRRSGEESTNLENLGRTEQLSRDPLKGKTKSAPEIKGHLTGETEGERPILDGHWEQELTPEARGPSHWGGKTKGLGEKNSPLRGRLGGEAPKNSQDLEGDFGPHDAGSSLWGGKAKDSAGRSGPLRGDIRGEPSLKGQNLEENLTPDQDGDAVYGIRGKKSVRKSGPGPLDSEGEAQGNNQDLEQESGNLDESKYYKNHSKTKQFKIDHLGSDAVDTDGVGDPDYTQEDSAAVGSYDDGAGEARKRNESGDPQSETLINYAQEAIKNKKSKTEVDNVTSSTPSERKVQEGQEDVINVVPLSRSGQHQTNIVEAPNENLLFEGEVRALLTQNGKQIKCSVDDFFDETIIFYSQKTGAKISSVSIELNFVFKKKNNLVKIQGDVSHIDSDGDAGDYLTVLLDKQNADTFRNFMKIFELRQESATEFLKRARGLG